MTEIKLTLDDLKDDGEHVEVWNLREHADVLGRKGFSWVASLIRNIADQIEEQVKPDIEEPTEFGSIVRAGYDEHSDRVLWVRASVGWYSEVKQGFHAFFAGLHDPEVLRVGLGGDYREGLHDGRTATVASFHTYLISRLDHAITAERKHELEKAIQVVEGLS